MVTFRRTPAGFRAVSIVFEKPPVIDSRTNFNVLALTPRAFAERMSRHYANDLARVDGPGCRKRICTVTFAASTRNLRVTFGRTPTSGSFLNLWRTI